MCQKRQLNTLCGEGRVFLSQGSVDLISLLLPVNILDVQAARFGPVASHRTLNADCRTWIAHAGALRATLAFSAKAAPMATPIFMQKALSAKNAQQQGRPLMSLLAFSWAAHSWRSQAELIQSSYFCPEYLFAVLVFYQHRP